MSGKIGYDLRIVNNTEKGKKWKMQLCFSCDTISSHRQVRGIGSLLKAIIVSCLSRSLRFRGLRRHKRWPGLSGTVSCPSIPKLLLKLKPSRRYCCFSYLFSALFAASSMALLIFSIHWMELWYWIVLMLMSQMEFCHYLVILHTHYVLCSKYSVSLAKGTSFFI